MSPKKCKFFQKETCCLGHVISADSIKTDPDKIHTIYTWPVPKDVRGLGSFLGLCSYYQRFMKGFLWLPPPSSVHPRQNRKSDLPECRCSCSFRHGRVQADRFGPPCTMIRAVAAHGTPGHSVSWWPCMIRPSFSEVSARVLSFNMG